MKATTLSETLEVSKTTAKNNALASMATTEEGTTTTTDYEGAPNKNDQETDKKKKESTKDEQEKKKTDPQEADKQEETTGKDSEKGKKGDAPEDQEEDKQDQTQEEEPEAMENIQIPQDQINFLEACKNATRPALIYGHTGTGKTTLIREVAKRNKKTLFRINLNGQTGREDLVGRYVLIDGTTVWQDGLLTIAMREGHWILLDEINAAHADVLLTIQAVIEVNNHRFGSLTLTEKATESGIVETIHPHKEFMLFATSNPPSYAGLKDYNTATLSRFCALDVGMPDMEHIAQSFSERYPKAEIYLPYLFEIIKKTLPKFIDGSITYCPSLRDIDHISALVNADLPLTESVRAGFTQKILDEEERELVLNCIREVATSFESYSRQFETHALYETAKNHVQATKDIGATVTKSIPKEIEKVTTSHLESLKQDIDKIRTYLEELEKCKKQLSDLLTK